MTKKDLQKEIKVQQGPGGQIFILPADILDNTVKAFSVSATSASGYGSLGAPSGRYFAPANGPDCIEIGARLRRLRLRSITVNAPKLVRFDHRHLQEVRSARPLRVRVPRRDVERLQRAVLQSGVDRRHPARLHHAPTSAPAGPGAARRPSNTTAATNVDNYRLTALLGDNQSRLVQLVWRLRW